MLLKIILLLLFNNISHLNFLFKLIRIINNFNFKNIYNILFKILFDGYNFLYISIK